MGLPRPGLDVAQVPVCANGSWAGERGFEAQVEVAADPAEQRGLHISLGHLCNSVMTGLKCRQSCELLPRCLKPHRKEYGMNEQVKASFARCCTAACSARKSGGEKAFEM